MSRIHDFLETCIKRGDFPGGTYAIGNKTGIITRGHVGKLGQNLGDTADDTIYDLASVTKPICATALMQQLEDGGLSLDDRVDFYLPEFAKSPKGAITIFEILTHTAPLAGPLDLYHTCNTREKMIEGILHSNERILADKPVEYSSLGFILLGKIMEKIDGEPLDKILARRIFAPLNMKDTMFNPPAPLLERIAPTEVCPWRGGITVRGQVHDENAVVLGGVCAHAGLFSTAPDLAAFCHSLLTGGKSGQKAILSPSTIRAMSMNHTSGMNLARGLGWQKKDRFISPAGDLFTFASYGHSGFTGTSIWLDESLDIFAVLLANRVHPTRENNRIVRDRHIFHNMAIIDYSAENN